VRHGRRLTTAIVTAIVGILISAVAVSGSAASTRALRPATRSAATTSTTTSALPPIRHVFIIVLENESESVTFGPSSAAPYLATQLKSQGAFVPNYYGVGHNSLDNYIAMIGGQPPNSTTQADCPTWENMSTDTASSYGAVEGTGCIYPADTPTIANQLTNAGLNWGGYMDEMGLDPSREASTCPAPVVGQADNTESAEASAPYDEYAERHDPFMYYDSITSNASYCQQHVVNLSNLTTALQSVSTTPNYVFITPDLCNDGHNSGSGCDNGTGQEGGLSQVNTFLKAWVPEILASPAYQQNGLLLITFDEASTADASSCCGEIAGPGAANPGGSGPGGGDVGAVMLSPFINAGTVTQTAYNHYSMLGSVEDLFGLPHIGYAQLPGETDFGSDIYTNYNSSTCSAAFACGLPENSLSVPALASTAGTSNKIKLSLKATAASGNTIKSFEVDDENLSSKTPAWTTLASATTATNLTFSGTDGDTYAFRVAATDSSGDTGQFVTSTTVFPSTTKPTKGKYKGAWKQVKRAHAWLGKAIQSSSKGASFSLSYTGGNLSLVGEKGPKDGKLKVTVDGKSKTLNLHAAKSKFDQTLGTFKVKTGKNTVKLTVVSGTVAIEGYGIASRTA
jgi:phosphatidylinositol-3-phosphatase